MFTDKNIIVYLDYSNLLNRSSKLHRMITNLIFVLILLIAIFLFYRSVSHIIYNIRIGIKHDIRGDVPARLKTMFLVAIGQSKMTKRPLAGVLHIFIYVGFILVNIEMLEILIDGISGSHRVLSFIPFYQVVVSVFEIFAVLVILACIIFLLRRNVFKTKRFQHSEMSSWPRLDANIILFVEILLMTAFIVMNASDLQLQTINSAHYSTTGNFLISGFIYPVFSNLSENSLITMERSAWWFHIVGVFAFLNYVPYSKHFHIFLSFPNVYYSKLKPLTYIANMESVTNEVKISMGLIPDNSSSATEVPAFGARDVNELSRKTLMDAYSCTECGRCTAVCPANLTGKKLSPRKIVMDTRDRLEELGKLKRKSGKDFTNEKKLLRHYILEEEIWACTTCNACSFECPVNIDPVGIIIELRRFVFMEESSAPSGLNSMSANIEKNGAPWQYSAADRAAWTKELYMQKQ